jgi:hypothetical protein
MLGCVAPANPKIKFCTRPGAESTGFVAGIRRGGIGVISNIIPNETPVIPAKAGIQFVDRAFPKVCSVDSRSPPSRE